MRVKLAFISLSFLLFAFSCNENEMKKQKKQLEFHRLRGEKLAVELAQREKALKELDGHLMKALEDLETANNEKEALADELRAATGETDDLRKKASSEEGWFEKLPEDIRKLLEPYEISSEKTREDSISLLVRILHTREIRIRELMIERDYFQRKFQQFFAALKKMDEDGLDVDKYIKLK